MDSPTSSKNRSLLRALLALFVVASCWKVWLGGPPVVPTAAAQIPDSGLQRRQLLEEVRRTNQLLSQLAETIKTHTFKVRIEGTDKPTTGLKIED